jgi:glycerol-3-phosphate dehydrogenase
MENPSVSKMISPSAGVHVVLPDFYSPLETGLIIPKTKVFFF